MGDGLSSRPYFVGGTLAVCTHDPNVALGTDVPIFPGTIYKEFATK